MVCVVSSESFRLVLLMFDIVLKNFRCHSFFFFLIESVTLHPYAHFDLVQSMQQLLTEVSFLFWNVKQTIFVLNYIGKVRQSMFMSAKRKLQHLQWEQTHLTFLPLATLVLLTGAFFFFCCNFVLFCSMSDDDSVISSSASASWFKTKHRTSFSYSVITARGHTICRWHW